MFYRYEIKKLNQEDVLYLYLTTKYEFSRELAYQSDEDLGRRTNHFIQHNHIPFHGNKVFLVIDGMIAKSIDLSKVNNYFVPTNSYSNESFLVHLELDDHSLCEVSLKEYLISILFSKYMDNLHEDVLKAISILYSTYAYKMMKEQGKILATNSFATFKPVTYYKASIENYDMIYHKLQGIVKEVDSMFLSYHDDYILPFIHYSNTGKTFTNHNYPYLSSVKSLWDLTSPYYIEANDFSYEELSHRLNISVTKDSVVSIYDKDSIQKITFDSHVFHIEEFKKLLNLKSTSVYIILYQNYIRILTSGWGNGYGLSIFGANDIANNGGNYYQILKYYFPKVKLCIYTKKEHS